MKKENSTNLQKYSGIAEQMLKLFSKHPETEKYFQRWAKGHNKEKDEVRI